VSAARLILLGFISAAAVSPAAAQTFPNHELRIYCGFPPGGGADVFVRYLAEKIKPLAGKPVLVENKVGAGGNLAVEAVTHAKPDGHTLVIASGGPASYNVHLYKRLGYDPVNDLTPVTTVVSFPFILVVNAAGPIHSVGELVTTMKARATPGSYGAVGGTPIVLTEMLKHIAGFDAVQVMYRNSADSINDLLSGSLDFVFMDPTVALAQVKEGRLRALAVSTPRRSPSAPDLPTMAETGFEGVDRMSWFAALMPANVPTPIVETWNAWFRQILTTDETKEFFRNVGAETFPGSPADLTRLQKEEIAKWADLVKLANMEAQ
jgi:tripartite-type tricarboxylate transporter receptor subunit TctC